MNENGLITKIVEAFKDWLGQCLPDCSNVTRTISESLDRRPLLWKRLVMKAHLFTCDRCCRYLEQIRFLTGIFHDRSEQIADPQPTSRVEFNAESRDRMRGLLRRSLISNT